MNSFPSKRGIIYFFRFPLAGRLLCCPLHPGQNRLNRQEPTPPDLLPDPDKILSARELDGQSCIGILGLPVLEQELPILDSWSYEKLKTAPCREYGSTARDMVLAGHNYPAHFGRLPELLPGDPVTFTDMEGFRTVYEVAVVETIGPDAVEKVRDSRWDLVLYTCTPSGRNRIMVGCVISEP